MPKYVKKHPDDSRMSPGAVGFIRLLLATAILLVASACGSSSPESRVIVESGMVANYLIPPGAAERVARGEYLDIVPDVIRARVGDVIVIDNQDVALHTIGPFTVRPGERLRHMWTTVGTLTGACSTKVNDQVTIIIEPAADADEAALPDVDLVDPAGEVVALRSTLDGRPLLLSLWATWCEPCRRELPVLDAFARERDDVRVLTINVGDESSAITTFLADIAPDLPVLIDRDGLVSQSLDVTNLPALLLLDVDGSVRDTHIGAVNDASLAAFVAESVAIQR